MPDVTGLSPISISSGDDGVSWVVSKKKKGKSDGKSKLPVISKPVYDDSEDGESLLDESIGPPEFTNMAAAALGACAIEWADELDKCRAKSRNLKGLVSGRMKRHIAKLRDAITVLVGKSEATGDPAYLIRRLMDANKRVKTFQEDNEKIKAELAEAKKRTAELEEERAVRRDAASVQASSKIKAELAEAKKRIAELEEERAAMRDIAPVRAPPFAGDPMDVVADGDSSEDAHAIVNRVLREHNMSPLTFEAINEVVKRPSIKGVSSVVPSPANESDLLLDKSSREIVLSTQIGNLKEVRRPVRADASKIDFNIGESASTDSPSLRGAVRGPVVISDVQLVPPRLGDDDRLGLPVPGGGGGNMTVAAMDIEDQWVAAGKGKKRRKGKKSTQAVPMAVPGGVNRGEKPLSQRTPRRSSLVHSDLREKSTSGGAHLPTSNRSERLPVLPVSHSVVAAGSKRFGSIAESGIVTPVRRKGRRVPKTAVVCVKRDSDGPSYAQLIRDVRERVNLTEIGIENSKIRWSANGSILIEIPGIDKDNKANLLAHKLKDTPVGASISRPVVNGELRIWGLDDSIRVDEIAEVVARQGGCTPVDVRVGPIIKMTNGLGSVWVRCPLAAAVRASSVGKIRMGWTIVRVELVQARPVQCFKCWKYGHVSSKCKAGTDHSGACFRCGLLDHIARNCTAAIPLCLPCREASMPTAHRIRSVSCGSASAARPAMRVRASRPAREAATRADV